MNKDEQTYHLINDYLNGELQGSELDKFKANLKEDHALQKKLASQRQIIQAIKTSREQELKLFLRTSIANKNNPTLRPKLTFILVFIAAIALISVVISTLKPFKKTTRPLTTKQEIEKKNTPQRSKKVVDLTELDTTAGANQMSADTQALELELAPFHTDSGEVSAEIPTDIKTNPSEEEEKEEEKNSNASSDNNQTIGNKYSGQPQESIKTEKSEKIDDEIIVRSDELIDKKIFSVHDVDMYYTNNVVKTNDEAKPQNNAEPEKFSNKATENEVNTQITNAAKREITVEYWKSVVNYIGYQYNGRVVKLYGLDKQKKLIFKELDNRLYTMLDGKYYFLKKNSEYNRLIEVTNSTLLNVLRE